jgi:hypothetical protein
MRQLPVSAPADTTVSDMAVGLRFALAAAATGTVGLAIAWDLAGDEHPTHTLGLALVVSVVVMLWLRLRGRAAGLSAVVVGVLALQPALHGLGKLLDVSREHTGHGVLHVLAADVPAAAMQIAVSAALVATFAVLARCNGLLDFVLAPVRLLVSGPPGPSEPAAVRVCTAPLGASLGHRGGWVVRAPRRGPPAGRTR